MPLLNVLSVARVIPERRELLGDDTAPKNLTYDLAYALDDLVAALLSHTQGASSSLSGSAVLVPASAVLAIATTERVATADADGSEKPSSVARA